MYRPARTSALVLGAALCCGTTSAAPDNPLATMQFLAGYCWHADLRDGRRSEHCFDWRLNRQHLHDRHSSRGPAGSEVSELVFSTAKDLQGLHFSLTHSQGGYRSGLIELDQGALIFPAEEYISTEGISLRRERWYQAGHDSLLVVEEAAPTAADGGWKKLSRTRYTRGDAIAPAAEAQLPQLAFLAPLLGQWAPDPADANLRHNYQIRDRVVMSLQLAAGGHFLHLHEGYPLQADTSRARLSGVLHYNPAADRVEFSAATRNGHSLRGVYSAGANGRIERIYEVNYQPRDQLPAPELPGRTRRYRETYETQGSRLNVRLELDQGGSWQPWGPDQGRYTLVAVNQPADTAR